MEIYRVGGAVRDRLLGLAVQDEDFVVVGATVDEMIALGFTPVGHDFPIFLHPENHQEYALARTERKTGPGYKGFQIYAAPEVTLEEDLARRDLTINAIAEDASGQLIDPFHGRRDLEAGILRHVSPAFVEDPVRLLRVARFAARFQFTVAPETIALMQNMVAQGEVDALVPERVWQELSRGLMASTPAAMFTVLEEARALAIILPELKEHITPALGSCLNAMAQQQESLLRRFCVLTFSLTRQALVRLGKRLRLPKAILEVAVIIEQEKTILTQPFSQDPATLLEALLRCDVTRRSSRFVDILAILSWGSSQWVAANHTFLLAVAKALQALNGGVVAAQCTTAKDIPMAIHRAQLACVAEVMASHGVKT